MSWLSRAIFHKLSLIFSLNEFGDVFFFLQSFGIYQFVGCRVHSGIRVHLTLRELNSLCMYPFGRKCTSPAFFCHAEDGKNIFISLLHSGGGKLATPPPLRRLTDSGIRVKGGFLSCGALLWSGVRLEHLEGVDLYEGLRRGHDFLQ